MNRREQLGQLRRVADPSASLLVPDAASLARGAEGGQKHPLQRAAQQRRAVAAPALAGAVGGRAGWLGAPQMPDAGRVSGCLLGKPLEVLSFQQGRSGIEAYLREAGALPLDDYVPLVEGTVVARRERATCRGHMTRAEPDDDIGYTMLALLLLEEHGAGFTAADDVLSDKLTRRALENGPHEGRKLDPETLEELKGFYYRQRGWDANGRPNREKLRELGLTDLAATEAAA